jgi:digeranylgeranylglycerophospholipid reductase
MNIAIIGAGPVGCYAGHLLSDLGHDVSIYEEHSQIGAPIQCTGLLTSDFDGFNIPKYSFLINTFEEIELNSSNHKANIKQKEYLICRKKFDNFIANMALKSGTKIFLRHSFLRKEKDSIIIRDSLRKVDKKISPQIVIAADGPLSKTAKAYQLYHNNRSNYHGIQATVKGNFKSKKYHTHFGNNVCPNLFSWIVPESDHIARVGLATTKNAHTYFNQIIKENNFIPIEIQSGIIPIFHPKQKLKKGNCYLLGDSAGFVKATTLGGIIPGMKQAQILARSIHENLDYEKETRPLKKKLRIHLLLRNMFNKFSDSDWDKLIKLMNKDSLQELFQKHTRENPFPLAMKAVIKEPKLLLYLKHLF